MEHHETLIVGGGQAGLATSYFLKKEGLEHIILEKSSEAASNWRNRCWDSFTLVTPNSVFRIPGLNLGNVDPAGFLPRSKVIELFENYIRDYQLPIKFNTEVTSIERMEDGEYLIQTNGSTFKAKNVIIASGLFQKPRIPKISSDFSPDILQIHTSSYRNTYSIPLGAVLIAGSGQSGCQIADELHEAGRKVFLCVGTAGRVPRRYRGTDIIEWLEKIGMFDMTADQLPPGMPRFRGIPHLTGKNGGYTINLHQFAQKGITLLGRLTGASNYKAKIAPDLHNTLSKIDNFELQVKNNIDEYIIKNNLNLPEEEYLELKDGYDQKIIEELDLKKENINTIIWAGGYTFDFSFIKLPVFDPEGYPIQRSGVTDYAGLYFVGLPWMPSERSGFLVGVAESARHVASRIIGVGTPA